MSDEAEEKHYALSVGIMLFGTTPLNQPWRARLEELAVKLESWSAQLHSSFNLNVVFQVPGRTIVPEFEGVRSGSFDKKGNLLMVQVALPEKFVEDPEYLRSRMTEALECAKSWATRKHLDIDFSLQEGLIAKI
jgi:hypothetical protein